MHGGSSWIWACVSQWVFSTKCNKCLQSTVWAITSERNGTVSTFFFVHLLKYKFTKFLNTKNQHIVIIFHRKLSNFSSLCFSRYRYCAYRCFVSWCWGYLGRKVRVVLPCCVVLRIRQEFPDDEGKYVGFRPVLDWSGRRKRRPLLPCLVVDAELRGLVGYGSFLPHLHTELGQGKHVQRPAPWCCRHNL